jgi:hypothetical protein
VGECVFLDVAPNASRVSLIHNSASSKQDIATALRNSASYCYDRPKDHEPKAFRSFFRQSYAFAFCTVFAFVICCVAMPGSSSDDQEGWHLASLPAVFRTQPSAGASSSRKRPPAAAIALHPRAVSPLRADAPGRKARTRGALPQLLTEEERSEALGAFRAEVWAPTTKRVMEYKLVTCTSALARWGLPLLPPTLEKITALGATLKAGNYQSASSYLSLYRGHSERGGFEITGILQRAFRDAVRSCERGRGGPAKARALPFDRLS